MGYIKHGNTMLAVGRVTREAKCRKTKSGKSVASFAMQYDHHHDEDGNIVNDYIDVSMWHDAAKFVGDEDVGVAKNDIVMVVGFLTKDSYHSTENETKYKISADIVLDMTSIFQVAQMVVNGMSGDAVEEPRGEAAPSPPPKQTSVFTETDEPDDNPFMTEEDLETELPY